MVIRLLDFCLKKEAPQRRVPAASIPSLSCRLVALSGADGSPEENDSPFAWKVGLHLAGLAQADTKATAASAAGTRPTCLIISAAFVSSLALVVLMPNS